MMNCYCPYLSRRVQCLHSKGWTVLCDDGCFPSLFLWVTAELCGFETILNNSTWAEREPGGLMICRVEPRVHRLRQK